MQFTIERAALAGVLGHVRGVVERRNTIPILSNVLIEADSGNKVKFTAMDLDIEVCETVEAHVLKTGATTVPAHLFNEIVRKLPDGGHVSVEHGDGQVIVKCGRSRFVMSTLPREDFPVMEVGQMPTEFSIPAPALANIIGQVKFAISTEETRYYLNGIYLHPKGNRLNAVTTDGHRLARYETDLPSGADTLVPPIVPRRAVHEIHRLIAEEEGDVEVLVSDTKIMLRFGNIVLKSKLIDGTYPPYERVIPAGNSNLLEAETKDLTAALQRVTTILSDRTACVRLTINGDTMTMTAAAAGVGTAVEEMSIEHNGPDLEIGFNGRYLGDILSQVSTPSVRFALGDAGTPAIIEPIGEPGSLFILMPLRV